MQTFVLQNGQSPLYTSSFNGHPDVVKTLIEAGANIDQTDKVSIHIATYDIIHDQCISVYMYM